MSLPTERTKEEILEKHCPSMNNLFLDKQGRAFRDRILAAMEEYKSQCSPVESKWVSVNKETPKRGGEYLVCADGKVQQAFFYDHWFYQRVDKKIESVTHWQPLPELPSPTIEETKEK